MKLGFLEKEVKQAVYAYLDARAYLYVPIQNQGTWDQVKKVRRKFTGTRGAPDLMVMDRSGRWLCIELKSSKGKQSSHQVEFEYRVDNGGGSYFVVRSINDLIEAGL